MEKRVELENQKDSDERWEIADRYREEGWSGKNTERPEFQRLMCDIEDGNIDILIVQKIDRVTRSLLDFFELWAKLQKYEVEFVSVNESFDTTSAMGRAMVKIILVFAELERETTAERTYATMKHRAEQGLWHGGRQLGYEADPDQKGVLRVKAEEARLVEQIYDKCIELGSAGKVTKYLAEQGIRRPTYVTKNGKPGGGGPFYKQTVIRTLTSRLYLGKIVFDEVEYEGQHDAIIERELYDRVQKILEDNREVRGNSRGDYEHTFLLQGLLRCGRCGSKMSHTWCTGRGGSKHFYYQCTKKSHSAGTECDSRYAPALAIEDFVIDQIAEWGVRPKQIEEAIKQAGHDHNQEAKRISVQINDAKRRLRDTKASLSKLVAVLAGGAALRSVEEQIQELEKVRLTLEDQIQTLEMARNEALNQSLSSDVIANTFCDFPFVVEKLKEAGNLHALKDILACYIAAIDLYQDDEDPQSGHMEITLFEEELPIPWSQSAKKDTRRANGVDHVDRRVSSKLPVLDTYRNFLMMPAIEGRLVLQAIRTMDFAA